jgi:hypothetical protein
MSKEQEYHPLMGDPAELEDERGDSPPPAKPTWMSKISRGVLVGLLAVETVALAVAIFALFARAPHRLTTCTVPAKSHEVLYCAL